MTIEKVLSKVRRLRASRCQTVSLNHEEIRALASLFHDHSYKEMLNCAKNGNAVIYGMSVKVKA